MEPDPVTQALHDLFDNLYTIRGNADAIGREDVKEFIDEHVPEELYDEGSRATKIRGNAERRFGTYSNMEKLAVRVLTEVYRRQVRSKGLDGNQLFRSYRTVRGRVPNIEFENYKSNVEPHILLESFRQS